MNKVMTDPYSPFQRQLLKLRRRYRSYLKSLPDNFYRLVGDWDFVFGKNRFLGEYFCFWLGHTLGIDDEELLQKASLGALFGRAFVAIQDRLMDEEKTYHPELDLLKNLFFQKFIKNFQQLLPLDHRFWIYFEKYYREYITGNYLELERRRSGTTQFPKTALSKIYRKTAIAKIPVAILALKAGKEKEIQPLNRALNMAITGIQICDDTIDWEEDLANQNFTYPLILAIELMRAEASLLLNLPLMRENIAEIFLLFGLADGLLTLSNCYLELAKKYISHLDQSPIFSHLDFLISRHKKVCRSLSEERKKASFCWTEPNYVKIAGSDEPILSIEKEKYLHFKEAVCPKKRHLDRQKILGRLQDILKEAEKLPR